MEESTKQTREQRGAGDHTGRATAESATKAREDEGGVKSQRNKKRKKGKEKKKQKETKDTEDAKKKSTSRSNCHVFLLFLP